MESFTGSPRHLAGYNADAHVFALLRADVHNGYNALDTAGWDFACSQSR